MLDKSFLSKPIVSMLKVAQIKEWELFKDILEKGQPAHSARSTGYSYRNTYYVWCGTVNYGEEIKIGNRDCGCG